MRKLGVILSETLPMPPVKGGAVENLLQLMINKNEKDNELELTVFSIYNINAEEESKSYCHTNYVYYRPSFFLRICDVFLKVIRRLFRNYLGILTPALYEIQAAREMKRRGIKKIVLANCPYFSISFSRNKNFNIIQYLHNDYLNHKNRFAKKVLDNSHQVIAVSNFINKRIADVCPSKTLRIDTCYNGIDLAYFEKEVVEADLVRLRSQYGINNDDKVILFIGRLTETKGVMELIQAFGKVSSKLSNAKLFIIGGQSFSSNKVDDFIQNIYHKANEIGPQVVFTGYVDYKDIRKYHQIAHLCVVPSVTNESFSLTSVEAQVSGLPVIVTDAGGIVETVTDESGIIVKRDKNLVDNLAKAMEEVLTNDAKWERMSRAAKDSAQRFPASRMFERFVELVK